MSKEQKLELTWVSVRAGIRLKIKKILRKHGYPPDATEKAADQVLEQADLLSSASA